MRLYALWKQNGLQGSSSRLQKMVQRHIKRLLFSHIMEIFMIVKEEMCRQLTNTNRGVLCEHYLYLFVFIRRNNANGNKRATCTSHLIIPHTQACWDREKQARNISPVLHKFTHNAWFRQEHLKVQSASKISRQQRPLWLSVIFDDGIIRRKYYPEAVPDQDQAFGGGSDNGSPKSLHVIKYPRLSMTAVQYHTKVVALSRLRK